MSDSSKTTLLVYSEFSQWNAKPRERREKKSHAWHPESNDPDEGGNKKLV